MEVAVHTTISIGNYTTSWDCETMILVASFRGKPIRTAYGGGWHTAFGKGRRPPLAFVETLGLRRSPVPALVAFVEPPAFI